MLATFSVVSTHELQDLRWMVARLIPHLDWRHSGLGVLQAYVREGERDELRVHVWHPSLAAPGIDVAGDVHDHRFDLSSTVLLGSLVHAEHELAPSNSTGLWRMHDVVHARRAMELTGSHHLVGADDPRRFDAVVAHQRVASGGRYWFPRRQFHRTVVSGLTVTLVRKIDQRDDLPARVAWPVGCALVHAFEHPLPRAAWQSVLDDAERRLLADS